MESNDPTRAPQQDPGTSRANETPNKRENPLFEQGVPLGYPTQVQNRSSPQTNNLSLPSNTQSNPVTGQNSKTPKVPPQPYVVNTGKLPLVRAKSLFGYLMASPLV